MLMPGKYPEILNLIETAKRRKIKHTDQNKIISLVLFLRYLNINVISSLYGTTKIGLNFVWSLRSSTLNTIFWYICEKRSCVKLIFSILAILFLITDISGQKDTANPKTDTIPQRAYLIQNVKRDGVTMPEIEIKEVTVVARPRSAKRNEYRK